LVDVEGSSVSLSGEEARHAARSLRMMEGEELAVGDGEGRIYAVALEAVRKDGVRGAIRDVRLVERERPGAILSQAVCSAARMDGVIARAAEAGIREVRPFASRRDLGAVTVRTGDLILRTESAGPQAAMVIRYHCGLLEPAGGDALG